MGRTCDSRSCSRPQTFTHSSRSRVSTREQERAYALIRDLCLDSTKKYSLPRAAYGITLSGNVGENFTSRRLSHLVINIPSTRMGFDGACVTCTRCHSQRTPRDRLTLCLSLLIISSRSAKGGFKHGSGSWRILLSCLCFLLKELQEA